MVWEISWPIGSVNHYREHRQDQGQGHFEPCLVLAPGFWWIEEKASVEENALTVKEKTAFYGSEDMMTSSSLIHKMQLCFPICCEYVSGDWLCFLSRRWLAFLHNPCYLKDDSRWLLLNAWAPPAWIIRDLKQHNAVMRRRRRSLAKWLFNCTHASLITDPIWIGILWITAASSWPRRVA